MPDVDEAQRPNGVPVGGHGATPTFSFTSEELAAGVEAAYQHRSRRGTPHPRIMSLGGQ